MHTHLISNRSDYFDSSRVVVIKNVETDSTIISRYWY